MGNEKVFNFIFFQRATNIRSVKVNDTSVSEYFRSLGVQRPSPRYKFLSAPREI